MAIDEKRYLQAAVKGDISGIALHSAMAFAAVADCLDEIRSGRAPSEELITRIRSASRELDRRFETLTGWTDEQP